MLSRGVSCLLLLTALLPAEEHWWRNGPLRIIDVSTSLTQKEELPDPAAIAARKAQLGFNTEHLEVMRIAGGLDDDHLYFSNKSGGKINADYLQSYLPEARKHGIRTLIYFDVHWYSKQFAERHPDWRQLRENGMPLDNVYDTGTDFCINTAWREWVFQMLRDLAAYPVDGIFFDGPVYRPDTCYCQACRAKFRRTYGKEMPSKARHTGVEFAHLVEFQANSIADFLRDSRHVLKSINPELALYMNSGTRGANWATGRLNRIIEQEQDILGSEGGFLAGDLTRVPLWKPSLTARLLETQSPDKPRVIFSAAGQKPWTFSLLPAPELRLLYASTIANAAHVWFGVMPSDLNQKEMQALAEMNVFLTNNQSYFTRTRSAAKVAIVWSDVTANFYSGAGAQLMDIDTVRQKSDIGNLEAEFTGIAEALLREHVPFDVIDDVTLERESLDRYDTIFLPNVACMSGQIAARLHDFVQRGGTIFSTFETSLYDEAGLHRKNFALADLFGASSDGKIVGPLRWDFMRPAVSDPLLAGLDRELLPSSTYYVGISTSDSKPVVYFTKPLAGRYDGVPETSGDASLVIKPLGAGRSVYFSGDLGASIQSFHHPELMQLASNVARDFSTPPASVEGAPGSVEVVVRTQERRLLVHLVNFTGEMTRPIRKIVPVSNVRVVVPGSYQHAYTLFHPQQLRISKTAGGDSSVTVPLLGEYEVVVWER